MTGKLTLFNFESLRKALDRLSEKRTLAMAMRGSLNLITKNDVVLEIRRLIHEQDCKVDEIIEDITRRYGVKFDFSGIDTTVRESQ